MSVKDGTKEWLLRWFLDVLSYVHSVPCKWGTLGPEGPLMTRTLISGELIAVSPLESHRDRTCRVPH